MAPDAESGFATVPIPDQFHVTVVLPGGRTEVVDGRIGKMIEWLLNERGRIQAMRTGTITFNLGPSDFQPVIHRSFDRISAPTPPGTE